MDDGLEAFTPACKEFHDLKKKDQQFLVSFQKELSLDQSNNLLLWKLWELTELKLEFLHQIDQASWCTEVKLATWTKYLFQSRNTTIPAQNWLRKKAVETTEPCSADWRQSRTEEIRATSSKSRNSVLYSKAQIPSKEVENYSWMWRTPSASSNCYLEGCDETLTTLWSRKRCTDGAVASISSNSHLEVRDGAVSWDSIHLKLMKQFGTRVKKNYSQQDCLRAIPEGSNKKRFDYCVNSKNQVTYVSAIQGHTGGNMISPEFLGHIEIPHTWKKFVFYDLN